jgi:hypothetical protein
MPNFFSIEKTERDCDCSAILLFRENIDEFRKNIAFFAFRGKAGWENWHAYLQMYIQQLRRNLFSSE